MQRNAHDLAEEYKFLILAMEVMLEQYPSACRLQTTVLYLGYDQDHEGEHCQADVSCIRNWKKELWEASVESILLCSNGSDRSREQVCSYIRGQKKTVIKASVFICRWIIPYKNMGD